MFMWLGFEAKRFKMMLQNFLKYLTLTCLHKTLNSLVGAKDTRQDLGKANSSINSPPSRAELANPFSDSNQS